MNTNDYAHHARFALAYAITHDTVSGETPLPSPETVRQMTERFLAAFPEFPRPREPHAVTLPE
jgi:hypothetical protein